MQKKPTGSTRTTTSTTTRAPASPVREALARGGNALPAEEDKALRMLHGASVPRTHVLERVGQDNDETREKLLGIELQLLKQWKARQAAAPAPTRAAREPNARRERIVSALKKKPTR